VPTQAGGTVSTDSKIRPWRPTYESARRHLVLRLLQLPPGPHDATTPAVASGLTDQPWSVQRLIVLFVIHCIA
jgi:hypothetical protein